MSRRWRCVVFSSPRRLNLRVLYTKGRLVKARTLDIWPDLPIVIHVTWEFLQPPSMASIISVLKHRHRVCKIAIDYAPKSLKEIATASGPFPALNELKLSWKSSFDQTPTLTLPDSFLGGSVPRLLSLDLWNISFPAMGKLLLSTRDLVTLSLRYIPPSGYISPEAMVTILSGLPRLKTLHLNFQIPQFWTDEASQHPPVLTRVVLPALTNFDFAGNCGYLEDMVSRIDAPLDYITVTFSDQLRFDIPILRDFIGRTKIFNAPYRTAICFSYSRVNISVYQRKGDVDLKVLDLEILYASYHSQLPSLVQACGSFLLPLPSLQYLDIYSSKDLASRAEDEVDNTRWTELLCLFATVKDLALDDPACFFVASALQELVEVEERVPRILPALQNIFLEGLLSLGPVPEGIAKFIAARGLSSRPIIVHHWQTDP